MLKPDIKWTDDIKSACETIIKNVDSIVGTEPYKRSINITIELGYDQSPNIKIVKDIFPERNIESYKI